MADFVEITTQEQFDAAIRERINRERDAAAKKYADYDELKDKVANYEKQINDLNQSMTDAAQKYSDYDKQLGEMKDKLRGYEQHSVKTRIAHEIGIPYELVDRLSGEDEDDIRKDAETLAQIIGQSNTPPPAPLKSTEPSGAESRTAALKALTTNLTKGE